MFATTTRKITTVVLSLIVAVFVVLVAGCEEPESPTREIRIPEQSTMEHWYKRYEVELKPFLEVRDQYLQALEQAGEGARQNLRVRINGHNRGYAQYEEALARVEELRPEYDRRLAELEGMKGKEAEEAIEELVPIVEELRGLYWQLQVDLNHMTWDMDMIIGWLKELGSAFKPVVAESWAVSYVQTAGRRFETLPLNALTSSGLP